MIDTHLSSTVPPDTSFSQAVAMRLPVHIDGPALAADLVRLADHGWTPHFNTGLYSGHWSVLPLRASEDAAHEVERAHNAPTSTRFIDLPVLEACPGMRAFLASLACEVRAARLLRLGAGAQIAPHRDHALGLAYGEVRLHVPVQTQPEVDFRVEGARVVMAVGELWYIDASREHQVSNPGDQDRIHLVVDCIVNDWLVERFRQAAWIEGAHPEPESPAGEAAPADLAWPVIGPTPDAALPKILAFLDEIGIPVTERELTGRTFLPGIAIEAGALCVDRTRLQHPGDLLHEAGHLAVMPPAVRASASALCADPAEEMMAIAWSWAALTYLDLPPGIVFHDTGYKGDAAWLVETFTAGEPLALPMLQWLGMTADTVQAPALGVPPFPHMIKWLRTADEAGCG
ncbi:aspartyl/asparaginyl beta-hydroxylase domain-containing protein [Nitrogeniibacter aestuarii]|uniref:aspartyl/asparaginyl beta-hydroxylase domain-containing protein n=1 Tax=Nitrogeniibacter aestuarii TaxID=2815343 RepID=UPI001E4E1913|nr:aspartyl/asparaginyl beta-hydroxylase domain-containing protein [Nitrogeniibacter aestuarii]